MKIKLQIIFLFLISTILTQDEVTLQNCVNNGKCLINGPNATCSENSITISNYGDLEKEFTNLAKKYKLSNINQIQCGTQFEKCASIEPGDIDDECFKDEYEDSGYSCCYIKLKYKYNTKYGCYPIEKKKGTIKNKIKEMKEYYIGVKEISIYCDESFVKFNFYTLILGFLILL